MAKLAPFSLLTLPKNAPSPPRERVLARVGFGNAPGLREAECPVFTVGLPLLAGGAAYEEYWLSPDPVRQGVWEDSTGVRIVYSENGAVLFGHCLLQETDFPNLRQTTAAAYAAVFTLLRQQTCGKLLRVWQYFPAITAPDPATDGVFNRYHSFCLGRQDALQQQGQCEDAPPAATAIGTQSAGFQLYFLAAKTPGMQLENPRQTSAFLYPPQHGPVGPAFSRATVKAWDGGAVQVYVSGTTSIVGHETRHPQQPLAQWAETLNNLNRLLQHGRNTLNLPLHQLGQLSQLKLYVQDPVYFKSLAHHLHDLREQYPSLFLLCLQGEVCRRGLCVEMEGIYA